jgi:hypothetical protein
MERYIVSKPFRDSPDGFVRALKRGYQLSHNKCKFNQVLVGLCYAQTNLLNSSHFGRF